MVELLADGLRRAGHTPMILAPTLGPQAERMRARGHVVVDRVASLPARPDVIHAQHTPVTLSALAAFPGIPTVFSCHNPLYEVEAPRPHPAIRRWIAMDELTRERCLSRGARAKHLTVIPNAIDPDRFARRPPLPARPGRALLLTKTHEHQADVRAVCLRHRLPLDELGPATGRFSSQIEKELPNYDLVFATERMALEAAAVGCAVIVCDARGFAGMLTSAVLPAWRALNFGVGLMTAPTTREALSDAIAHYDAGDAALVTDRLRTEASIDQSVARHLEVYAAALADPGPMDAPAHAAATAAWIEDLVPATATRDWQVVAREIFRVHAVPPEEYLQAMEQRLREEIGQQAELTRDTLTGLRLTDAIRVLWWRFLPRSVRLPFHRAWRNLR